MYDPDKQYQNMLGITDNQALFEKIDEPTLYQILGKSIIHSAIVDTNNYGEYLFITISIDKHAFTFYGLGFHEHREQWEVNHWNFYKGNYFSAYADLRISEIEASIAIETRKKEIRPYIADSTPSLRGEMFTLLEEIADSDFALLEIDDFMNDLGEMD